MAARNVCIPIDGSEHCVRAYEWYKQHMAQPQDHVIIIHAVEPPSLPTFAVGSGMSVPTDEWARILTESNKAAADLEAEWTTRLRQDKRKYVYKNVMSKKPGEGIVNAAKENEGHVLIMGNRGLGKIRRTILGSVSEYVIHHAGIPTTIVPPEKGST